MNVEKPCGMVSNGKNLYMSKTVFSQIFEFLAKGDDANNHVVVYAIVSTLYSWICDLYE